MDNLAALIELAIGLVFVYLALSLACSQVLEIIARMLNWRAKQLEEALMVMIATPEKAPGMLSRLGFRLRAWVRVNEWPQMLQAWWSRVRGSALPEIPSEGKQFIAELYAHPLIKALTRPGARIGPEYIPRASFSLALFNTLMREGTQATAIAQALQRTRAELLNAAHTAAGADAQARAKLEDVLNNAFNPILIAALPQNLTPPTTTELLQAVQSLAATYPSLKHALAVEQLRLGVEAQKSRFPDLYRALQTLLREAETDVTSTEDLLNETRSKVEAWYDSTMDRATVWYKQHIQWVLFAIGLVLASIINVDSIRIADTLWREPTLRQAVADQARVAASSQPTTTTTSNLGDVITKLNTDLKALSIPVGWKLMQIKLDQGMACAPLAWLPSWVPWVHQPNELLGLPINGCAALGDAPSDLGGWGLKGLGLLISGLAAMQGAPFWFDLLQKLVNVGQSTRREKAS